MQFVLTSLTKYVKDWNGNEDLQPFKGYMPDFMVALWGPGDKVYEPCIVATVTISRNRIDDALKNVLHFEDTVKPFPMMHHK